MLIIAKDYLIPEDFPATSTIRRSYFEINKYLDRVIMINILYIKKFVPKNRIYY